MPLAERAAARETFQGLAAARLRWQTTLLRRGVRAGRARSGASCRSRVGRSEGAGPAELLRAPLATTTLLSLRGSEWTRKRHAQKSEKRKSEENGTEDKEERIGSGARKKSSRQRRGRAQQGKLEGLAPWTEHRTRLYIGIVMGRASCCFGCTLWISVFQGTYHDSCSTASSAFFSLQYDPDASRPESASPNQLARQARLEETTWSIRNYPNICSRLSSSTLTTFPPVPGPMPRTHPSISKFMHPLPRFRPPTRAKFRSHLINIHHPHLKPHPKPHLSKGPYFHRVYKHSPT